MKTTTIKEMFDELGYSSLEYNAPADISDRKVEILSYNTNNHTDEFSLVTKIVRKPPLKVISVICENGHYLQCAPNHQLAVASKKDNHVTWVFADYLCNREDVLLITANGISKAIAQELDAIQDFYDLEVEGNHCYYSNGILSHNTMFGPDKDTVGGEGWKYGCSLRVEMRKGKRIKVKQAVGEKVVGINGSLTVNKNRLRPPFAKAEFNVFFDKGIDPLSGLYQICRDEGVIEPRRNEEGGISKGWWTYKGMGFHGEGEFGKVLQAHPELLGGHDLLINMPAQIEIEGADDNEEEENPTEAEM